MKKSIEKLSTEDFKKSPRWMFYSGKDGELDPFTTLIPEQHEDFNSGSICLIKTKYIAANGMPLDGFCYDIDDREDHTIFYEASGFSTWYGIIEPSDEEIIEIYNLMSLGVNDLFPITYKSYDGVKSGSVKGIYYIENDTIKIKR